MFALWTCAGFHAARAGAFMEAPGAGQIIVTSTFTDSTRAFDAAGRVVPVLGYRKLEISAYGEYGVTEWLTAIASPTYESVWSGGPPERSGRGAGASQAGARVRLLDGGAQVVSAQTTIIAPNVAESIWRNNSAGADLRLLYGARFDAFSVPAFVDIQAAYRHFGGQIRDEMRLDATIGLRPWSSVLLLAQSFNIFGQPHGALPHWRSHKLQASVVYEVFPGWSMQAGAFASVFGVNTGVERGYVTALWRRF